MESRERLPIIVPLPFIPTVDSYRATGQLARGDELPNSFLSKSRWLAFLQEKIL